ncbi:aspartate aminotransferase family protein [Oleidesulfovibrio sp.]|uniref:class-III pyridoxal-phosphate-dependent aminotransferase n=1 Tax=Oleidesulfovibrio sp. TaxID=2909707 RepID=UPI003A871772
MTYTFPFTGHTMLLPEIVRADNCELYDAAGNRYLDLEAGVWCTSVGHGHPAVKKAISEQMERIAHVGFCYTSQVVERAAAEVLNVTGHPDGKCVFLCSGSEAIEYGLRVIRALSDKPKILTMADSYFGAYGDAAGKETERWVAFDWFGCEGCPSAHCGADCARWASIPFESIGAFLLEPGSSSGMVSFPPAKLLAAIGRQMVAQDGYVMINEVTTGVGRTGAWFGFQHYDLQPDIVALGKGIGNGYPVSVTSMGARVVDRLGGRPVAYAQSHQNDPLGAVVAESVVTTIRQEELLEKAQPLSTLLLEGLRAVQAESGKIAAVRGRGLMVAVELTDDGDHAGAAVLHERLVRAGYIVAHRPASQVLRIDPALTIAAQDIELFLEAFSRLVKEL